MCGAAPAGAIPGAAGPEGAGAPPPDDSNKSPEEKEAAAIVKSATVAVDAIIASLPKPEAKK